MMKKHRRSLAAAIAALVLSLGLGMKPAHAALISYMDRASFDLANPGLPVEGFQKARSTGFAQFTGPLNSATNNASFQPGDILPGISFFDNPGPDSNQLALLPAGLVANPTTALAQNGPKSDALDIAFGTNVGAVGFDIFQNFAGSPRPVTPQPYPVSVFGAGNVLLGSFTSTVPTNGGFFGVSSTNGSEITRVSINNTSAFDVVDNVAFGTAVVVPAPEPPTWAMMLLGLASLAISTRRKKQPA